MTRTRSLAAVLPALFLATGFVLARPERTLPRAEAKPEYAKKEKKDCAFCHVNPKGGGARNDKGNEYEKNGHKFPAGGGTATSGNGFGENKAFANEANGKAFDLVRRAIDLQHWGDAYKRIAALEPKEKKGPGAQLLLNTKTQVDNRGRDLAKAAKEAIQSGKAAEAAEAIARLETEFKGRDPAKEVSSLRASLEKLPGGKEADAAAKPGEVRRIAYLDALMKDAEGQRDAAVKALQDLIAKAPEGPFAADAKKKLEEWGCPLAPEPAMGG